MRKGIALGSLCFGLLSPNVYPSATPLIMKNSGLRIRIERELREKFLEVCREQDRPAAQVIREFMREYIASHQNQEDKRLQPKSQ